jgi:NAD(P)-dependent dehydrogenase (short-subunit alcohol dehydrogenase family)
LIGGPRAAIVSRSREEAAVEDLNGRVAVVTGAASGIGAGLARALAREGMHVVLADIELAPAQALARELEKTGVRALAVRTDVTRADDCEALAAHAVSELGAVHLLCNNAGVCMGGPIQAMTERDWRWVLSVNLEGVVNGCRAFVPRLLAGGGPAHILNTASVGGFLAGGSLGLYTVSKFAVVAFSESLAQDLAPHGIGVSILCPGATRTNLGTAARNRPAALGRAEGGMQVIEAMMEAGMDPLEVGRHAVRGIRENALYVFTDSVFKPVIESRFARVLAALDRAGQAPG